MLPRWIGDVCVGAVVQTGPEVVQVRLVRQCEAPEVSHPRGNRHRPLALLRHQGEQLLLWPAQRHHVRNQRWRRFAFSLLQHLFPLTSSFLSFFASHIRWGAPPVINPEGSSFPNETLWSPGLSLSLPVTSQSSTTFNLSNPAAGDWFVAAHLPVDDGRIEQKVCEAARRTA